MMPPRYKVNHTMITEMTPDLIHSLLNYILIRKNGSELMKNKEIWEKISKFSHNYPNIKSIGLAKKDFDNIAKGLQPNKVRKSDEFGECFDHNGKTIFCIESRYNKDSVPYGE